VNATVRETVGHRGSSIAVSPEELEKTDPGDAIEIRTPDQRLRVFVSSTLQELAEERQAAVSAIARLRLTPVLFEIGARPHPPRSLYRAYLAQSDVFIGIYWQRYGWIAPGEEISGLEDEFQLSGDRPKLIYIKTPAPERESRLSALLQRIRDHDDASHRKFNSAAELQELIENDLALLLTEHYTSGHVDHRSATPHENLPAPRGRLVDRVEETAAARKLLQRHDVGLVTLTGPGGTGKTRLALHVAAAVRKWFPDGVLFVDLSAVSSSEGVLSAIARSAGLQAAGDQKLDDRLADWLRPKTALLVLDNFEHVLPAAGFVAHLLEQCPRLKVLATSRAPLRVRAERELLIPPLTFPEPGFLLPTDALTKFPAIQLFVQRARDVWPDFTETDETSRVIAEICARLDGLPLAIELAAARIKLLSPQALLARLEHRLPVLVDGSRDLPERQQTLRRTIAWSYDLLGSREASLFRRLAVFVGGFDLSAAEKVAGFGADERSTPSRETGAPAGDWDSEAVLAAVESLLDNSLLTVRDGLDGERRFAMLETIREFGLEQLALNGEEDSAHRRHAAWIVALSELAEPGLRGAEQGAWMARLDAEHANIGAALEWLLVAQPSPEGALRLASAVWQFWWCRGSARDGRGWLERALQKRGEAPARFRAKALVAAAELAECLGDYPQAAAWHQESLAISRSLGDDDGVAAALNGLGLVSRAQGGLEQAEGLHEEALAIMRRLDDRRGIAKTLNFLGAVAYFRGDADRAERLFVECAAIVRDIGDQRSLGAILSNLGAIAVMQGDPHRASVLHREAVELARRTGDVEGVGRLLGNLGEALRELGDYAGALAAYDEALKRCRRGGEVEPEAVVLHDLGKLALAQGDLIGATLRFAEALRIMWQTGNLMRVAIGLEQMGTVAALRGEPVRAARLCAAASAIREATGASELTDRSGSDRHLASARALIGNASFEAAWAAGAALTPERAVTEGLDWAMNASGVDLQVTAQQPPNVGVGGAPSGPAPHNAAA
jgi:predicted ATPase